MSSEWSKDPRFAKRSSSTEKEEGFVAGRINRIKESAFQSQSAENLPSSREPLDSVQAPMGSGEEQLEALLEQAKAEVAAEIEGSLQAKFLEEQADYKTELREKFEEFLRVAEQQISQREPFLKAVRDLSLAFAEQLAMHAFSFEDVKYGLLIDSTLEQVEMSSLYEPEVLVSPEWGKKIANSDLQSVLSEHRVNIDDRLNDGDVVIRSKDMLISNLVADRVASIKSQLDEMRFDEIENGQRSMDARPSNEQSFDDKFPMKPGFEDALLKGEEVGSSDSKVESVETFEVKESEDEDE